MAKKQNPVQETIQAPVVAETQALSVPHEEMTLAEQLTALGASAGLVRRVVKASSNFALMETPKIPRAKALADGVVFDASDLEEVPVKEFQGVIAYGAKQKAFYEKDYDSATKQPPECFSHGGRVPDSSAAKPQAKICKDCPKNKFETAKTGKGKACRDLRRLFFLRDIDAGSESIMPIQFNITPTSLKNFDDYLSKLVTFGMSLEEVVTKVTGTRKSRDDKYMVFSFSKVRALSEDKPEEKQIINNIQALKTAWLPHMERAEITLEDIDDVEAAPVAAPAQASGEY